MTGAQETEAAVQEQETVPVALETLLDEEDIYDPDVDMVEPPEENKTQGNKTPVVTVDPDGDKYVYGPNELPAVPDEPDETEDPSETEKPAD